MSDKENTQGQDLAGEPNEEREEDTDGADTEEERLVRQRASHEARRRRAKTTVKKGLVIINTGKGKTTAPMGLLLRAWGQGLRMCMLQYIKARTANWGEEKAARKMGMEMIPQGDGFTWLS